MDWKLLLAYMTGAVDRELRLHHAYLVTENRILRRLMTSRMRLSGGERTTLAEPGTRLGKPALKEVASLVTPDTILAWHRQLIAKKDDGSEPRQSPGRPTISAELEALVVRLAWETRFWGDDRMVGVLANLGFTISAQTVGNCSSATASYRRQNGRRRPRGTSVSPRTWRSSWPPTASRPRSGRRVGW